MQLPNWMSENDRKILENEPREKLDRWDYLMFREFLQLSNSPKAKKVLKKIDSLNDNIEWQYLKQDLEFKAFLKNF